MSGNTVDGAGPMARHAAYVGHPEADGYSKHLLTLLAQRRELQTDDVRRVLADAALYASAASPASSASPGAAAHGGPPDGGVPAPLLPASIFSGTVTAASIDKERRELQSELSVGLEWRPRPSVAEACRAAVEGAGKPLAGLPDAAALTWHFRARRAELAVEQRQLLKHVAALRRQHLSHVVMGRGGGGGGAAAASGGVTRGAVGGWGAGGGGSRLPSEVTRGSAAAQQGWTHQLDHAGSAYQGELRPCLCERELAAAGQCLQAMQRSEADIAARLGRLTSLRVADDSDWWAALHWAAMRLPAGRVAERFFDRIRLLPLSHHHRFPIYEQVAGAALRRDQHAAGLGLRLPPRVVTSGPESVAALEALMAGLDLDELLPQGSNSSSESMFMTIVTDNSARHHKAAYDARRMLPKVMARHCRRWPGASLPSPADGRPPATAPPQALQTQASAGADAGAAAGNGNTAVGGGEAAAAAAAVPAALVADDSELDPYADDPNCSVRDQVHLVRVMEEELGALVPSLEGDESAGWAAVLRTLPLQVDEVLKAENAFLDEADERAAYDRLRSLAEAHVDRWSQQPPPASPPDKNSSSGAAAAAGGAEDGGGGAGAAGAAGGKGGAGGARMTLSLANQARASQGLQDKNMEALYIARYLATKRNKLRVLHYLNAIVSLQLQLLRDEAAEEDLAPRFPPSTTAAKDFTCPFVFANGGAGTVAGAPGAPDCPSPAPAAAAGAGAAAAAADVAVASELVDEMDCWVEDVEAGVAVRAGPDGRWLLYGAAVGRFHALEGELLRVATYHLEAYAAQAHTAAVTGTAQGAAATAAAAAAAAGDPLAAVDRLGVVADLWECEAQFAAARHKALLAYYQAYRHATGWGLADIWAGCNADMAAAGGDGGGGGGTGWARVSANSPQPQLLGARRQLRREMIDLCFRRPALALEDGYFAERYHADTLGLELEATLAGQLTNLVARHERQALAAAHTSAAAAASAAALLAARGGGSLSSTGAAARGAAAGGGAGAGAGGGALGEVESIWKPGYNPGIVYGGVIMVGSRGLLQEGATLAAVGAAAAALPAALRAAAASLAELHQLRHHVELADLRRAVLTYGVTEMGLLLREEAHRAQATVERQPKDSMYDGARGKRDLHPDAPLLRGNWLCVSHVADNAEVLRATALEECVPPRAALEVFLNKEALVRQLYRGELLWLVGVVQARALGRKVLHSELFGIDWGQIDAQGNALKAELLSEVVQMCEPSEMDPPGVAGPGGNPEVAAGAVAPKARGAGGGGGRRGGRGGRRGGSPTQDEEDEDDDALEEDQEEEEEEEEDDAAQTDSSLAVGPGASKILMVAVGTGGALGGVWRCPPLALAEFSTAPAELLNAHSLGGLRAMLRRGEPANACLPAAVRAQVLRAVVLEVSIRHNQVLLDGIIRKLDRRRRVLMWRMAAMEGVADDKAMDVVVGGPPGSYAPAMHPLNPPERPPGAHHDDGRREPPPPLMRNPPGEKLDEYQKQRRSSGASASSRRAGSHRGAPGPGGGAGGAAARSGLDERSLEDLKQRRRALTAAAGALYLDINEIKLRLRVQARRTYVQGLVRAKGGGGGGGPLGPEVEAAVRSDTESAYAAAFLGEVLPAAARTQLAVAVRELAVLVLGSTGGYGADWGIKYDADGQLVTPKEDRGPLFQGPEGQTALRAAVMEYAPLWQNIMFQLADKPGDPDPMDWSPAAPAVGPPPAIGFVQLPPPPPAAAGGSKQANSAAAAAAAAAAASASGAVVRLESLWGLPGQWDVLHSASLYYPPGPGGLAAVEKGVAVASLVNEVVRHFIFTSALLAPSALLAAGGDVSGQTSGLAPLTRAGVPPASAVSYNPAAPNRTQLYQQSEARMLAAGCSFLPGALLAADLVKLQARLQYLHRPAVGAGAKPAAGAASPAPQPTQPADEVVAALRRELAVAATCRVLAVARARDGLLAAGPAKKQPWYLAGALEHSLARSAAAVASPAEDAARGAPAPPPSTLPPFPAAFALRLPDADRLAIHNEAARLALALERSLAECRVPAATAPNDVMAISEYFVAGMWVHDRLRDALAWRSMLMESPEAFPFAPPRVCVFLRRYHSPAPPLVCSLAPPPAAVEALQAAYTAKVTAQAKSLVAAAEQHLAAKAAARAAGHGDDDGGGAGSREAGQEGKPHWLAASPAWLCGEARLLEGCVAACKQQLDLQAVQVALLRLHQDCTQLAGLRAVTAATSASVSGEADGGGGMLHPHALPAAALGGLARKLMARQRRGGPTGNDAVVELSMDELTRWLGEAASTLTASARAGAASASAAAARERAAMGRVADELAAAVSGLADDNDTFMRRHAIKVDTQVVDRAMSLLLELSQARRQALRAGEDSRSAMEAAFVAAQKQYAAHIDDLNNQLIVARTNSSIMRSELQKAALEALIEVRRETLNRAFNNGSMKMTDEVGRMLALERQLEESQTEILDLQRAISKVQAWFKMRSAAFLTACLTEVAAARGRAEALEAELWEARERSELALEQLGTQLKATQADLEAVSAGAARNASDLRHALASNKKLLKWKITTAPRIEALKMRMAEMTKHREAWLEWVNSKQGLMAHLGTQVMAVHRDKQQLQQQLQQNGSGGAAAGRAGAGRGGRGGGAAGGGGGGLASDAELEAIREQWEMERRHMQQEISHLKSQLANERLVKNDAFERLLKLEQQYMVLAQSPAGQALFMGSAAGGGGGGGGGGAAAGGGGGGGASLMYGRSALSPVQVDILSRRYEELRSSHDSVRQENEALRRTLAALRTVAPDLVHSLEFPLMLQSVTAAHGPGAGGALAPGAGGVVVPHGAAAVVAAAAAAAGGAPRGGHAPAAVPTHASVAAANGGVMGGGGSPSLIRPGTAGRLRPQSMMMVGPSAGASGGAGGGAGGAGAGAGANAGFAQQQPAANIGLDGGSSGGLGVGGGVGAVHSPARRGVGASGARPPSAATYAARSGVGTHTAASPSSAASAAVATSLGSPVVAGGAAGGRSHVVRASGAGGGGGGGYGLSTGVGVGAGMMPMSGVQGEGVLDTSSVPTSPTGSMSVLGSPGGGISQQQYQQQQQQQRPMMLVGPAPGPAGLEVSATKLVGTPSRPGSAAPGAGRRG
ncbi:hypothetical protein HYH02_006017 [Chlamydomonas schloesseri]|uniref:Uncharacterized protein n=1 Tax=Chlamydomonas schloesseri TaxID=2026947 RepID=A0A835WJM1_9CHLO|nr:hypothetical protein HYH02_006017 [Chlamydomonas schloesseri]|eukprot:KAG2448660.1 hypothetical protein HYH02_006017 [Chlamydomonas schloesseri]